MARVVGVRVQSIRNQHCIQQYVREIRNLLSHKESVGFRDFEGNDHRLRPFTASVMTASSVRSKRNKKKNMPCKSLPIYYVGKTA